MPETKPTGGDASNSSDGTLDAAGPSGLQQASQSEPDDAPGEFSEWFDAQPETVRTMVESHIHGLKSALERVKSERSLWREKIQIMRQQVVANIDEILTTFRAKRHVRGTVDKVLKIR